MTYDDHIAPPSNLASLGAAAGNCQATVLRPAGFEATLQLALSAAVYSTEYSTV